MKKKLLHVFSGIEYSGAERMIFTLRDFYNQQYETHVVNTLDNKGEFYQEYSKTFRAHHIIVSRKRNFQYLLNFLSMINFYRKYKIDIVHIHPSERFFFHVLAAKLGGVKRIVRQIHNNFQFKGIIAWKESALRRIAQLLGVYIVSISESVRLNEKEQFGIDTIVVNNFFDDDVIFPASVEEKTALRKKIRIPPNAFCMISVGSCIERKQHRHIIEAMSLIKQSVPSIYYIHLGDGPVCDEEKSLLKGLDLDGAALFAGNQDNVRDYLVCADVYVMTSQFEGLSISTLEAMGAKIPVVLYNTPGSTQLGENGAPGILINPNSSALADSVKSLFVDRELLNRKALDCYQHCIQLYSKGKAIKEWKKIYDGSEKVIQE